MGIKEGLKGQMQMRKSPATHRTAGEPGRVGFHKQKRKIGVRGWLRILNFCSIVVNSEEIRERGKRSILLAAESDQHGKDREE